jgi:hypothetical protein
MEMQPITNLSKITPPRVPGILPRSRLIEQICKNQDKRLLLILGQAAQGKSTLAAVYAGTQETPVAWLNLDQGDSDPVNLFYGIINAFQHCLPDQDISLTPLAGISLCSQPMRRVKVGYFATTNYSEIFCCRNLMARSAPKPARRFILKQATSTSICSFCCGESGCHQKVPAYSGNRRCGYRGRKPEQRVLGRK